ncbi:unnamed protein product, partial [Tetraodon nigroviridis]
MGSLIPDSANTFTCMILVQISVWVLTTGSAAERPVLSPRQYRHVDADSGTQLVCDKCPAGTFVSLHCSPLLVRECSPCPNGTFTRGENGVEQCHRCRPPCPAGLVEKLPCTTTQDRVCTCPTNSFLPRDGGTQCKAHSLCPPGTRMKKRGGETEDVVCKPCSKGTFSSEESHSMSIKRSSRVLKKGPMQDPSSIMEKAIQKKPVVPPTQVKEKWIYYSNGQGVDILKLVAAQVGTQWIDVYQSLANATEREVAAFSNGYSSDHERAYAALQHWTIRDGDANLAKLINALHRQRRIDVVEKIRCVMEDNPQVGRLEATEYNHHQISLFTIKLVSSSSSVGGPSGAAVEQSPVDRTKGFFPDESEPLLRCDSTSSKDSALSRNGSFITKEKKDTVLRQVRLDPCDLQPIFDDMLHILNPEELHVIEGIPAAEDKLDRLFEIAGVKSQEASQTLLDSVYSHLPDLL